MRIEKGRPLLVVAAVAAVGVGITASPLLGQSRGRAEAERSVVKVKDARLKFELNATDGDGGVQVFIDADSWKSISLFDPSGRRIFTSTTGGRMAKQGGTELFLESAEPPFERLPIPKLLERFPEGTYAVRGVGLKGERYVGSARLSHDLPAGPELVSPLAGDGLRASPGRLSGGSPWRLPEGARSSATRCSSYDRRQGSRRCRRSSWT